MPKLFFDIETIPSTEEQKEVCIAILKKKDGNGAKNGKKSDIEIYKTTSLEGTFVRVCCIGVIKEGANGINQKEVLSGDEKEILTKFWQVAQGVDQFIGHNIWGFDLPFIYKRSIINGVKPRSISFARYRNIPIYDTMVECELWSMGKGHAFQLSQGNVDEYPPAFRSATKAAMSEKSHPTTLGPTRILRGRWPLRSHRKTVISLTRRSFASSARRMIWRSVMALPCPSAGGRHA